MQDFAGREAITLSGDNPQTGACPLSPETFIVAMTKRWSDLGNTASEPLKQNWGSMAAGFSDAIINRDPKWRVFQLETGTGKTQGLCVYAALTITKNLVSPTPIGMLVVTPTIRQATKIVDTIRSLLPIADAARVQTNHSQNNVSNFAMEAADMLVVTHAAYTLGLEGLQVRDYGRWNNFANWAHGPRRLTIIDEELSGLVQENQLTAQDINIVLACMNPDLLLQFPTQVRALWVIRDAFHHLGIGAARSRANNAGTIRDEGMWTADGKGRPAFPYPCEMAGLREAISGLPYDRILHGKKSLADRARAANRIDKTLQHCEAMMKRWCYYHQKGLDATLNSSQLLIPPDFPGPVVLDATASQHLLWVLLQDRAELVPVPSVRNYSNVNLHVALANRGLGKGKMQASGKMRTQRLLAELIAGLSPDRRVLLILHKDNKPFALNCEPGFAAFSVANWRGVNGKNDWHDYDTAVIFGMPYRDEVGFTNMFSALQGPQNDEWLEDRSWGPYPNVHQEMQMGHLVASILQAANRVRCRRMIDVDGNCPPTEIFIILKAGDEGRAILHHIQKEMPGVVVKPWAFELDGPQQRIRKGSFHDAVFAFMQNQPSGETKMLDIKKELGIPKYAYENLMRSLRDETHPLCKALAETGVYFVSAGRGSMSFLLKR